MKTFTQEVPGTACTFDTIRKSMMILAWTLVAAICLPLQATAQSYSYVDVKDLGFSIEMPNVVLDEGEWVDAEIMIGDGSDIVGAIGFELWLELGAEAQLPTSLQPSMTGSWMADPAVAVTETQPSSAAPFTYKYDFERGSAVDGHGMVLKVRITAAEDDVETSRLVANAGGLMQIDNLELRTADLSVWPNPVAITSGSSLNVQHATATIAGSKVISLDGRLVATYGPLQELDLSALATGTYWLHVTLQSGEVMYRKLQLN
jgi:hypothetical protein